MTDDPLLRSLPPVNGYSGWKSDSLRNLTDSMRRVRNEAIMADVHVLPPLGSHLVAMQPVTKPVAKKSLPAYQPDKRKPIGNGWILPKIPGQSQRLLNNAAHQRIPNGKRFFESRSLSPFIKTTKAKVVVASSPMVAKKVWVATVASTHHARYEAGNALMRSRKVQWLSASEKTKAAKVALDTLHSVYKVPFKSSGGSRLTRLRIAPSGPGYAGSTHFPTVRKLFRNHTGTFVIAYQGVDRSKSPMSPH